MIFPRTRIQTTLLPAFLALAFFALYPLDAQTAGSGGGVRVGNTISMNSSATVDSFDSTDWFKSADGLYDPAKRQANGNIFVDYNKNSDLHNAFVYGDLNYSGPAVKNCVNVQGNIVTPSNAPFDAVEDPTWPNGTFVQGPGGNQSGLSLTALGSATEPYLVKINGDFTISPGKTFTIYVNEPSTNTAYLTIWVTGKLTISGSIIQSPAASVTWIVDKDIAITSYQNGSGYAANLSFEAVGTGKVNINGKTNLIATVNAPSRNVNISETGGLSGGVSCSTLVLGAGSAVHCDEGLAKPARELVWVSCDGGSYGQAFPVADFVERDIRFTGQPDLLHSGGGGNMPDNFSLGCLEGSSRLTFLDVQGRPFALKKVDLAEYDRFHAYPDTITFVGSRVDGTTASQTFVTDGVVYGPQFTPGWTGFETFTFGPEWHDLIRVDMQAAYGFSIDNIVLER